MKLLLIKDEYQKEEDLVDLYETSFRFNHFEVKTVSRLDLNIEKIKEEKPDFILMLLLFPPVLPLEEQEKMDVPRIKFLETLKENKETKDIPVFVLGNYEPEEINKMNLKLDKYFFMTDYTPFQIVETVRKFREKK